MSRISLTLVVVGVAAALAVAGGLAVGQISPALALTSQGPGDPGYTERVSIKSDGTQGDGDSSHGVVSSGGRYSAFSSSASTLVESDLNSSSDVFLRDRISATTIRISVATDGTPGNNHSHGPAISSDGSRVAFYSQANNLVADDHNGTWDIFVRDWATGQTSRVSLATDGTPGNEESTTPAISANGNFVAFTSWANNLVAGDNNLTGDVFMRDLVANTTTRISVASDGIQGNGYSRGSAISSDGGFVAFVSSASTLVISDTNNVGDIFVRDTAAGVTTRVSIASGGAQALGSSSSPAISGDGRYVAFSSEASNLVVDDNNGQSDAFVHDRQTGQTKRVSISSGGLQANSSSFCYGISGDGTYIVFASDANNLVAGDTNPYRDIFVHNQFSGETTIMSVSEGGASANSYSDVPDISVDGRWIAYASQASNLVSGDSNGKWDVFVRDRTGDPQPTATPTETATATATTGPTATEMSTITATPTGTTQTATPTGTATATRTSTPATTPTPTRTATWTPHPTNTRTPTRTATATWIVSPTPTRTPFPTSTPTATVTSGPVHPSTHWVNFHGTVVLFDGSPAPYGTIIDAFDPDGVRCGTYLVTEPGQYGPMPVYEDDTTTPEDDGANAGDEIRLAVNGLPALHLGPDLAIWSSFGDIWQVNLRQTRPGNQTIPLRGGWNLVSFRLDPHSADVWSVMKGVSGDFTSVQGMTCQAGALSYYVDLPPALNSLKMLDGRHGYWVYALDDVQLVVQGNLVAPGEPLDLCPGYNLVSYLPAAPLPVPTALASIAGKYDVVLGFDPVAGGQSYYPDLPPGLNSLKTMGPGRGYWIHMLGAGQLIYPMP